MASSSGPSYSLSSLDEVVSEITRSKDDETLNKQLRNVAKESQDLILASLLSSGQDPLDVLEVPRNTLGLLYILSARFTVPQAPSLSLRVLQDFCAGFDPAKVRLAPARMTMLAKGILSFFKASNALAASIPLLKDLVTRYPPDLSYLTTIHPVFLRACVATRNFDHALPVLIEPIKEIDTTLSDLRYYDNLVYHYAGGIAFAALKRWAEAEDSFEIVVGSPAQVPSAIQLEALKKLVLVQLIAYGKLRELPKYASPSLTRPFKTSIYGAFANSYPLQTSELERLLEKEASAFEADKNVGLVRQAIQRSRAWSIKKLTETYISLSLSEIGQQIGVADEGVVRSIVLNMIEGGEIGGSISLDGIVTFEDSAPSSSKAHVEAMLAAAQQQALSLAELDRKMGQSRDFLSKSIKSREDGWGNEEEFTRMEKGENWTEESLFS